MNAPRRVVFDHQIFSTQQFGGISRLFSELARHLAEDTSWKVRILAPVHVNEYLGTLAPEIVIGWKVRPFRTNTSVRRWLNTSVSRALIKREKPAIIHETYYSAAPSGPRRVPSVVTVYDMIHELFPTAFPEEADLTARKRAAVVRAAHVICISESTRNDLLDYFPVNPAKVSVVHLGPGIAASATSARSSGSSSDRPYLLFVGERGAYKNFIGLVRALQARPEILRANDLLLFGGGPLRETERALLATSGIAANAVRHVGSNGEQLAELYRNAAALVYPSLYEGFGLPILEAMSCNCPVVCGTSSSIAEVAGDAAAFCDPADPESLGAAITHLLDNPDRAEALRQLGQKRARLFSWSRCARETAAVYEAVLAHR